MSTAEVPVKIWKAFKERCEPLAVALEMPIAWALETFEEPEDNGEYLRVDWLPNVNGDRPIDSDAPTEYRGLFQLSYFARLGELTARRVQIAGKIAKHFPADLPMSFDGVTVRVTRTPDIAQGIKSDTHIITPVTIRYECFA